jgi:hypothetical protein
MIESRLKSCSPTRSIISLCPTNRMATTMPKMPPSTNIHTVLLLLPLLPCFFARPCNFFAGTTRLSSSISGESPRGGGLEEVPAFLRRRKFIITSWTSRYSWRGLELCNIRLVLHLFIINKREVANLFSLGHALHVIPHSRLGRGLSQAEQFAPQQASKLRLNIKCSCPLAMSQAKPPPDEHNLRYAQYELEREHIFLDPIRQLISKDLSEPYSIYVYRYFLNQWGNLCYMVSSRFLGSIILY